MQHDVVANPAPGTRRAFPFITVLQADLAGEGSGRIVAPLAPRAAMPGAIGRLLPIVTHDGAGFLLALELMTSIPGKALRHKLGSTAAQRDDITRAPDWVFSGV